MELEDRIKEMRESFPKNVKEGSLFLDRLDLNWYEAIDVDKLDLSNANTCVLGQKFGGYWSAISDLGLSVEESAELGFNVDHELTEEMNEEWWEEEDYDQPKPSDALWAELKALWVAEITARQEWQQGKFS